MRVARYANIYDVQYAYHCVVKFDVSTDRDCVDVFMLFGEIYPDFGHNCKAINFHFAL